MKDRIFIGWSGSNEVALKVKNVLENRCNYKCSIGGNCENDSKMSSVGDTVIQQIKNSNQAIIIFQNRADGQVSNNLFFELGYTLASYGVAKIHCVRRASEQITLPSDFDSAFVEAIDDTDEEKFIGGIVRYFLDRQKLSVNTNKMYLIDNRYIIRGFIQTHFSEQGSKCSDYELAQYLLFYMQAANMFGDVKKVQDEILAFKAANQHNFSAELAFSVNISLAFFELVLNIKNGENGTLYIDKNAYHQFKQRYDALCTEISDDPQGIFDNWAMLFLSNHMTYGNSLYTNCPDLSDERRKKIAQRVCEWADKAVQYADELVKCAPLEENNDHIGLLSFMLAYTYRNRFLAERILGNADYLKWLEMTRKERVSLKKHFGYGSIDTHLSANIDMEYYLNLIEYLSFAEELDLDEDDVEIYLDEIKDYLDREKNKTDQSKYLERIDYIYNKLAD